MRNRNVKLWITIGLVLTIAIGCGWWFWPEDPVDVQFDKGYSYYTGEGCEKDLKAAFRRFRRAAQRGHIDAQHYLAECYLNGCGTEVSAQDAVRWYLSAAKQSRVESQLSVAKCFKDGIGSAKNLELAYK